MQAWHRRVWSGEIFSPSSHTNLYNTKTTNQQRWRWRWILPGRLDNCRDVLTRFAKTLRMRPVEGNRNFFIYFTQLTSTTHEYAIFFFFITTWRMGVWKWISEREYKVVERKIAVMIYQAFYIHLCVQILLRGVNFDELLKLRRPK